jgi:hypothetical protein
MPDPQAAGLSSLEAPTMVSTGGHAPVMAMIEHASQSECRMRSVNVFEVGERLDFSLSLHGAPPVLLAGTITSRKKNGPRYAYVLAMRTTPPQAEAIARATEIAHGRTVGHAPDVHTGNGLTRASVRIPVDFEMHYTHAGSPASVARATNISTGGILMNTSDELPVGASLEMQLPLGDAPTAVHGRVVAHQRQILSYNIAFYEISNEARESIARFIETHAK